MVNTLVDNGTIRLGYVSDNEATVIQFPIANIIALLGNGGDFYLLHRRPEDETAYAVPSSQITTDDAFLYWTVAAYDVAQCGNGECQLQYRIGSVIKMTQKWRTAICASLVDGGEVPTPYQTWLDDLADIADRCEDAEAHYPQIGANGNWFVWDVQSEDWVDTGFPSGGTTYHTITETEVGGTYKTQIYADSDNQFAVHILSEGGVGINAEGGDIMISAPGSTVKVNDELTVNGNRVLTEPVILYTLEDDNGNWIATDANGTPYTMAQLLAFYQAGRSFALCDNNNMFEGYASETIPMNVIEDVSDVYTEPAYFLSTGLFTTNYEDVSGGDAVQFWCVYTMLINSGNTAWLQYLKPLDNNNKVTMTKTTASSSRRILFSPSANDNTETAGVEKSSKLLFNPSSGNLTVNGTVYNKGLSTDGNASVSGNETVSGELWVNSGYIIVPNNGTNYAFDIDALIAAGYMMAIS